MLNLDKDKYYLLACSYGPDSMALFSMLLKENYHFSAALVNYHLREESDDEMNGFIDYCNKNKITYHIKDLVGGVKGKNIEAECRKIRYQFFATLVKEYHYDAVLVAHHEDDVIETYLMQKKRQNLVNFYGIKEKTTINDTLIIRPLLSISKAKLLEYCKANNVPFMIDVSNYDVSLLRNKIRHEVVAKMNEEERLNIIKEIDEKNREIDSLKKRLESMDINDINVLKELDLNELAIALNILIKRVKDDLSISMKQVREISKLFNDDRGNIDVPIRDSVYLRKSYSIIEFYIAHEIRYSFIIKEPMIFETEYFYLDFTKDSSNRNVSIDDYPLTIRNYRDGDKYHIKDYGVQVRRLFIDWKMPKSYRERWPIILNKDGHIIYIPRYRSDFLKDDKTNFYVK